jgi:enoyl-CoA hydratase
VRVDVTDLVATITLNDPARRNAIDADLGIEMVAAFDKVEARDDVRAVIVTGTPPAFCAGADLSQLEHPDREALERLYAGFLRVATCRLPTIAAVNGPAVGAGMNLALACDLRLAGAAARFETRFVELGLHPGGGHTWMLRRIAGVQTTTVAVLFGEALSGKEAERCGLVWRCVADEDLMTTATRLALHAADAPGELVSRVKATLADMAFVDSVDAAVERELDDQVWSLEQPAFRERLAAMRTRISTR